MSTADSDRSGDLLGLPRDGFGDFLDGPPADPASPVESGEVEDVELDDEAIPGVPVARLIPFIDPPELLGLDVLSGSPDPILVGGVHQAFTMPSQGWSPYDQEIDSEQITGSYDGWVGRVVDTFYDAAEGLYGTTQAIIVERVDIHWGTNNYPSGDAIAPVFSQPTPARALAKPWPARHDQPTHLVSKGDTVGVISGRDGRHWFLTDDLPFPGVVIAAAGASVKESNSGGAGNFTLTVKRQGLDGDPTAGTQGLIDLQDASSVDVTVNYVYPIMQTNQAHGYRVGDQIWVQKRGLYYFALPTREGFLAYTVDAGPDGEADHTDNSYWLREVDTAVTASGDNDWTVVYSDRSRSANQGRWVKGINNGEQASGEHKVDVGTEGSQDGTFVWVTMAADSDGRPYYAFSYVDVTETIQDQTGIDFIEMDCLDYTSASNTIMVLDERDWRNRVLEWDLYWDEEVVSDPFDKFKHGGTRIASGATGPIPLIDDLGSQADGWEFWVDGDDGGKLKLTVTTDTKTTELTWKFTAYTSLGDCQADTDCTDCDTNCAYNATTNAPTGTVTVSGSCTDLSNICTNAAGSGFGSVAGRFSYDGLACEWTIRDFDGTDAGYRILLRCESSVWQAAMTHTTGGGLPTNSVIADWANIELNCEDGKTWGSFSIPGTNISADCDGCTFNIVLTKDPT